MGGFFSFSRAREEQQYGFFDCSPGCRASSRDVRYCVCRCRGINHGALLYNREIRPIPVPSGPGFSLFLEPEDTPLIAPQKALPHIQPSPSYSSSPRAPRTSQGITSTFSVFRRPTVKRRVARRIAKSIGLESADSKNDRILSAMRKQFPGERLDAIIQQAFTVYHTRNGPDANRPELYELYENSDIDKAIEFFGTQWVIGRPRKDKAAA